MSHIQFALEFSSWWVGLGILSSIGLGSGLQSGVLFLFPHIIKVSLAAQTCNTLDFESYSDIWFNSSDELFKCPPVTEIATPVTFFGIWRKIILVCFLQSTGTAIGEIPPYWMTKSAREAALRAKYDVDENIPEELETNSEYMIVNKGKIFLIWLLKKYGFYGVLLMASYPNIAFDLCGICCGHFLMPFWSFFLATFVGKAIIRNSYQSFFYVMICRYSVDLISVYDILILCYSEEYLEKMIKLLQFVSPDAFHFDETIRDTLENIRNSFHQSINSPGSEFEQNHSVTSEQLIFWWKIFMSLLISSFLLSCISHFAQYYQLILDQEDSLKLRNRLAHNIRLELTSPVSGRLKLPPPTPLKIPSRPDESTTKVSINVKPLAEKTDTEVSEPKKQD
jgi:membrane protein YqaA with SNARE-associated domain